MLSFFEQTEDVLEWVHEWEQRSSTMDAKHVEVLVAQWKLMREGAKEHAQVIHQMKKAMQELRAHGMTLQDRLDELEKRVREDVNKEQSGRLDDLERRLGEKISKEQSNRESDVAALRDWVKGDSRKTDERIDGLKEQLSREVQVRQSCVEAIQKLLAKETEVLREVKGQISDETAARERSDGAIHDRVDRLERLLAEGAEKQAALEAVVQDRVDCLERLIAEGADKQAALQAAVQADLASGRDRADRHLADAAEDEASRHSALKADMAADVMMVQGRLGGLEQELRRERAQREGADDRLREQLEAQARERDLGAVRDLVEKEKGARERLARSLQDLVKKEADQREADIKEVRSDVGAERAARERGGDALRLLVEGRLDDQRAAVQERVEHLLRMLHQSSDGMVQTWRGPERAARAAPAAAA